MKINEDAESNVRERTEQSNIFADPLLLIERSESEQPSEQWPSEQSEQSIPASSRTPSPPRQIAARTPSPPTILEPQPDNLDNLMRRWQRTQDERDAYADSRRELATRSRGRTAMENEYARGHEHKVLRERLIEQRDRRILEGLQAAENQRKLRRPYAQTRHYTAVPMGLPYTSFEWASLSEQEKTEAKQEKIEEQEKERIDEAQCRKEESPRTIEVSSQNGDSGDNYYFKGTKLFKVKSEESYDREDRDLAASLRRNAAAAAATVAKQ